MRLPSIKKLLASCTDIREIGASHPLGLLKEMMRNLTGDLQSPQKPEPARLLLQTVCDFSNRHELQRYDANGRLRQADACEFFRALANSTELISKTKIDTEETSACEFCKHQNVTPTPCSDSVLLLNAKGGVHSVASLASQVFDVEDSGKNSEPCDRCNKSGGRVRCTVVKELSDVLAVQIIKGNEGQLVELSPKLSFEVEGSNKKKKFRLCAVVCFSGIHGSGHYWAHVCHQDEWWELNDAKPA